VDPFQLRGLEAIIGEEASGPVSPVTPKNPSRPQTPETPGPTQTTKEGTRNMATPQGAIGGGVPPVMITTEQLQQLLNQLQPHRATGNSNPKVEDPELYYRERQKLWAFLT
jgi:hypothetical protein